MRTRFVVLSRRNAFGHRTLPASEIPSVVAAAAPSLILKQV